MIQDSAGFLALLRRLEREAGNKPRIGLSTRLADDIVDVGQDAALAFPVDEVLPAPDATDGDARVKLRAQFMGFFGPQGALPLNLTEEVLRWQLEGEDGFARFADIFASRFYQLFFRAWSDAHAISQHDRPDEDNFARYIAAISGMGSPAFMRHDGFPDIARLPLVSIFGGRVRSGVRLRQMLSVYFDMKVEVDEHVPNWLEFEPDEIHGLGVGGSLGQDSYLGSRVQSVNEKICIRMHAPDAEIYRSFLPGQQRYQRLADLVFWYLGRSYDIDVALTLPPKQIPPGKLGETISIGWLAALAPPKDDQRPFLEIARFSLFQAS